MTTARDPGDLDPAVFAQASATQWEVVADALVTLDEYESAHDREIACIRESDSDVSVTAPSWDRFGWTLGFTLEGNTSPRGGEEDRCGLEHRALTEVVWIEQPPDANGVVGAMGSTVAGCLDAVRTGASTRECPDALREAASPG